MDLKELAVTEAQLAGTGVIGLADTPGLSVAEMQEKFEETARKLIIPRFNALVKTLAGEQAAESLGVLDPCGSGATSIQQVLTALKAYTDEKLIELGTGDMAQAIYDPQGRHTDIFAAVDAAKRLGLSLYRAAVLCDGFAAGVSGYSQRVTPQVLAGEAVTAATQLAPPMLLPTGEQATDEALAETLALINAGFAETAAGSITLTVWELPATDIELYWYGR